MPTYNRTDEIKEAINSVLSQTFQDFEIIIVDDDSPDGTGEVADELARRNSRVRVLHRTRNRGLGRAYIDGMKIQLYNVDHS